MRGPGIIWMLETAAGLSMAGPMLVIGVEFLRSGQYAFGIIVLAAGAVALYFPTFFRKRIGGPRAWVRRRVRRRGDGASNGSDDAESRTETGSTRVPLLDRFRNR